MQENGEKVEEEERSHPESLHPEIDQNKVIKCAGEGTVQWNVPEEFLRLES